MGTYGTGGGMIGLTWCGAIAVLVLALILSVSALLLMQSGSTSSSTRKGRLRWLGILFALTVTNVVLWWLAYGSESAVFWLSPRGVSEIFGWLVQVGGSDFGMEAFTCLAITVGAAIILTALNARTTSCPGPPTEALGVSGKSRLVTSLFALFLGVIGAHRFYVGKRRTASLMLGLAIAGFPSLWLLSNIPYMTWIWHVTQFLAWIPALLIGWIPFFGWIALLFYSPFFVAVFVWSLVDFGMAVSGNMRDSRGKIIKRW
jgi:hypothetical protein